MPAWSDNIAYINAVGGSFAYRPGELIGRNDGDRKLADAIAARLPTGVPDPVLSEDGYLWFRLSIPNVLGLIDDLRADGFTVEPNYVLFAHDLGAAPLYGNPLYGNPLYGNPLYGNPLYGNPLYGNPLYGNPLYGNPLYGNPLYGNPLYGNPLYGNPLYGNPLGNGPMGFDTMGNFQQLADQNATIQNTARPGLARRPRKLRAAPRALRANVVIFDSGLSAKSPKWPKKLGQTANANQGANQEVPDADKDKALDPVAGHGTFIAGLIELLAPGSQIQVVKVFQNGKGDVDEATLKTSHMDPWISKCDGNTIVNLSLGGYTPSEDMMALGSTIRLMQNKGAVVVASAGNDGIPRPSYPAAFRDVVSVGALGPMGPAAFSNWGPWVRACAPGVNLTSTFFPYFDGPFELVKGAKDPDEFSGWARWTGTSFAAPVVVAALAREMFISGSDAKTAVEHIIDAPGLARLPGLGTIVNLA